MRTIRIKIYKFNELSEQAKEKAIEHFSEINVDYGEWYDLTVDNLERQLEDSGYIDAKILFSGFSSQGDGACFTCPSIDFNIFLDGKYKDLDITANITHLWRYFFATSTTVDLQDNNSLSEEKYFEVEAAIKEDREKRGNDIYRILEKEWDWRHSREQVIETIEANEYEFTKDGKPA